MQFCPPNDTFVVIWSDHGMSRCFMETLSSVITMAIILICGIGQMLFYSKYSTSFESFPTVKSRLYNTQVFITFFMPLMSVIRFMLESSVIEPFLINGYMIVYVICDLIKWPFSYLLMKTEREKMLPTIPTKGHGLLLNIFWALCFVSENLKLISINKESWWFNLEGLSHKVEFSFFIFGYVGCFLLFILGLRAPGIPFYPDVEQRPLLQSQRSTFRQMFKKLKLLVPFLWPQKSVCLQLQVLICILILIAGRFINVLTPLFYKRIVNALSGNPIFCWQDILVYVMLAMFQGSGSMGLLNNLRTFLWIRIQQYTSKEVQVNLFAHLHSLSLRWHLGRKTGEVLRVVDRGVASSNSLLSYVLFNILPTIVDILIAVIFFVTMFNAWFGFIIFTTMTLYLTLTIIITEWRTKFRRSLNKCDNELRAKSVDSLLNFETVKYHNNEEFEVCRYSEAVKEYQSEEFKSTASLVFLNTAQIVIMNGGFLVGALLCAYLVSKPGHLTVGDYVLFSSYVMQLYTPLNWFGTYYRMIQQSFIDMENMFDLLDEQPEVVDRQDAAELAIRHASIEFKDVSFSYNPERVILRNISFVIPANSTVALVGPSGCGKTTILRLLFRLYDPTQGDILIDEQNIKDVKQASLRSYIGVVPQDCVLFNEPVLYNIHYGNVNASPDDVINAAKRADIHDRILTFPEGYHTVVGERGLKLSGGEKQRIAIARMILKDPTIILMDEATSSLDTQTERNIQTALLEYFNSQTTLVVAHRLSTVVNADQILVMNEGEIVERGCHSDLLALGGMYSAMWAQQMDNEEEKREE